MPSPSMFKLGAFLVAAIACLAVVEAWRSDRRDRAQLAAELAATKQLLTAADVRQRDRDAQLAQTLSALEAQKRDIVTPSQIVRELAKNIPLPAPLSLQAYGAASVGAPLASPATIGGAVTTESSVAPTSGSSTATSAAASQFNGKPSPVAVIPTADLKPLYDFTLDCQACQAKLSVAQNDLADEKSKTAALTKERDDAIRLAKGGSTWHRITRTAKWFLLGAAAGAVVAKSR